MTLKRKSPAADGANSDRPVTQDGTIVAEKLAARRLHMSLWEFRKIVQSGRIGPYGTDHSGNRYWSISDLDVFAAENSLAVQPELSLGGER